MGDDKPKINLYNLGTLGVNRVLSPIHKRDGELMQAQNAAPGIVQGRDALKKRWGMTVYNATPFAAGVIAIHNLPYGGFGDPSTSTGSTGSTASWAGWTEPFATWQINGPGYWDGTPYTWSLYGTWGSGPWTAHFPPQGTANPTTTGLYHAVVDGFDGGYTQGDVVEYDVMTPAIALKVNAPSPAPGSNPDSGNGWRVVTRSADDRDFVLLSFLDYAVATGYRQWHYAYQVSADAWVQVGDMAQWNTGSTYPMMRLPQDRALAFKGRIYILREQLLQSNQTQKYRYTIESASATSTGSWTVHLTWDGGTTYESTLYLFGHDNCIFVSGRLGGSAGGGAPYTYVNKRSFDGSVWSDVPSIPNSTYTYPVDIDKERTTAAIFAYGDGFNPGGGTVYPLMVSNDESTSWTTVSGTDTALSSGGLAASAYGLWRAGDQYFLSGPTDGLFDYVYKSSASTLPTFNWSTVSDLGDAMSFGGASGQHMSLTPKTRF